MFKLFRLKLRQELEELKSLHRIELAEKEAALKRAYEVKQEDLERLKADLEKDHEIKLREVVSLLKLESQQKMKQQELDHERKIESIRWEANKELTETKEKLLQENYKKLSDELAKLHSEGNNTTKFVQDLALSMVGHMPETRTQTKVLISDGKEKK